MLTLCALILNGGVFLDGLRVAFLCFWRNFRPIPLLPSFSSIGLYCLELKYISSLNSMFGMFVFVLWMPGLECKNSWDSFTLDFCASFSFGVTEIHAWKYFIFYCRYKRNISKDDSSLVTKFIPSTLNSFKSESSSLCVWVLLTTRVTSTNWSSLKSLLSPCNRKNLFQENGMIN